MKESKKRENSSSKKKKHGSKSINMDSWDQSDLEFADEKVLERRLHHLKLQLQMAQDETPDSGRSSKHTKNKKKPPSDDSSSDSDSSDSDSSFSSASSSSVNKYGRKSSSPSEDDRKKRQRSPISKKKLVKESKSRSSVRIERENNSSKNNKKMLTRRKTSPESDKRSSRPRSKRSPSLDKKEVYKMDTSRWHDKAKEAVRERSKQRENDRDRSRVRSRQERTRSTSTQRDQRNVARSKERSVKKTIPKPALGRRKESPEPVRARVSHDPGRRTTLFMRKNSPRDERLGRHDDRRLDLKVTRRNEIRAGDIRDMNLRITKDNRDRKETPIKPVEKPREREPLTKSHREPSPHRNDIRDRSRVTEDRLKERDKRLHERAPSDLRNRNDNRDPVDDKFRRNERSAETTRSTSRHVNESVFDRMRNRYNDRRNADQRFPRVDRDRSNDTRKDRINDKEPVKNRSVDSNGADRMARDRRPIVQTPVRARSPYRDRKEPLRSVERRTPVNYERKFSSPTTTRKAREDNHVHNKRKSLENDDQQWNKKKGLNKTRSRSRSSEKRKRRRSSQEEWRIIDMTSPVVDEEISDENANKGTENNCNKVKRTAINKIRNKLKNDENDDNDSSKVNKTILTDELSDISDDDFNDVNASNSIRCKKENIKLERLPRQDRINRKTDQKDELEFDKALDQANKNTTNDVDDIINNEKLNDENNRVDIEKNEHLDSEEETVSRVSDAIGVDWAELVEETKKKPPDIGESSKLIRQRWNGVNIFSRIGVSEKYAGKEMFDVIQKDLRISDESDKSSNEETKEDKILHSIAGIHVCLRDRAVKRRTLFEPYKTAISARKDIVIRRRLCSLPVKNINAQHMIGICHWIV